MNVETRVQILCKAVCISHSTNTFGKDMNPNYSLSSNGQIVGQTELFNFGMATSLGERKLNSDLLNSALKLT